MAIAVALQLADAEIINDGKGVIIEAFIFANIKPIFGAQNKKKALVESLKLC